MSIISNQVSIDDIQSVMLEFRPEKLEYGCKIVLDWFIFHKYTKHYAAPIKKTLMSLLAAGGNHTTSQLVHN